MSTYDHHVSNFGRPHASRWFVQRFSQKASSVLEKLLKGFYHIWAWQPSVCVCWGGGGGGGATILAIFHSPAQERLRMKFEQHWPEAPEEKSFEILNIFPNTCVGKQTWPRRKKVKCLCMTIILATLLDRPSPIIYAKIQPKGFLGSGEEDF